MTTNTDSAVPLLVWLVEDDTSIRWVLERALHNEGIRTRAFDAAEPVLTALAGEAPDVLLTDIRMPGKSGLDLLQQVRAHRPGLPVIVMTAHSDLPSAVSAYEGGAFEYLPKPFDIDHAVELVRRAGASARCDALPPAELPVIPELLGKAAAMQAVFRAIGRLARSSVTVLITGESGTGKELVARALHEHSPRAGKPFIAMNSAAIPAELLESELFGHERGAFTGAESQRRGRFEQASGGTLFLDEIGDMPIALQTRLLRVLAEGEFYRVGGQAPIRVDVRVIAATHQDLEQRVARGEFREDLFHRLNVIRIELPALRQRSEDIPALLEHYLAQAATELATERKSLSSRARQHLVRYGWPGNVRELVNLCRRLVALAPGSTIELADLPVGVQGVARVTDDWGGALTRWADAQPADPDQPWLARALPQFERVLIEAALRRTGGHRQEAARVLGWGRNTLARKCKELGINE
ncbi:MAG: nitrogen regulation protein NR(I) [Pseudomonadales bacterium]|nr:nitrogen regulation protein NR(I) [Pseudomonadales bacterium]